MGYEGDACSFTCNTGYELTGNDTRTCQSDGSWSDTADRDKICIRGGFIYNTTGYAESTFVYLVPCPPLNNPNIGMINCSLGDDGVPSYEDTCSFTCNTGYELTGSDTRTCQNNGSWSSSDNVCKKGEELRMRTSCSYAYHYMHIE